MAGWRLPGSTRAWAAAARPADGGNRRAAARLHQPCHFTRLSCCGTSWRNTARMQLGTGSRASVPPVVGNLRSARSRCGQGLMHRWCSWLAECGRFRGPESRARTAQRKRRSRSGLALAWWAVGATSLDAVITSPTQTKDYRIMRQMVMLGSCTRRACRGSSAACCAQHRRLRRTAMMRWSRGTQRYSARTRLRPAEMGRRRGFERLTARRDATSAGCCVIAGSPRTPTWGQSRVCCRH